MGCSARDANPNRVHNGGMFDDSETSSAALSLIPGHIPASIGQQVFTITSGIAGGLAGLVLANRLKSSTRINLQPLLLASVISAGATFAVVFLITSPEGE